MSEVIYHKMTPEEREQEIERLREKARLDHDSMIEFARNEGRAEVDAMVAANLRQAGFSEEQIQRYTGVDMAEVILRKMSAEELAQEIERLRK